jgi:hypothetical protein
MAGENNLASLDGLFKVVYGDKIENLQPENTKLLQRVPFSNASMIGKD